MRNKMFKRCIVSALTFCMMFSQMNLVKANVDPNGAATTVTVAELVASNYEDKLSDAEKTVINNASINSDSITYNAPTAATTEISVDADLLTVTAKDYKDGELTWIATSFDIIEEGNVTQNDLPISNEKGNFAKPSSSAYSVDVTYTLEVAVDAKVQKRILNTPYYLLKGYEAVDAAEKQYGNTVYLATGVAFYAELKASAEEAGADFLNDEPETIAAIDALVDDFAYDKDLGAYFFVKFDELAADYDNYAGRGNGNKELEYVFNGQGYKFLTEAKRLNTHLQVIYNSVYEGALYEFEESLSGEDYDLMLEIDELFMEAAEAFNEAMSPAGLNAVHTNEDTALLANFSDVKALRTAITAKNVEINKHDDVATKDLFVADAVVRANMNTNNITVKLEATVVNENNVETKVVLEDSVTLKANTPAATVKNEVTAMETALLTQWADAYQVNGTNYTVTYPTYADVTADATYTITYVPNTYEVKVTIADDTDTYNFAYGYNYTLPKASEEGRTYTYSINGSAYSYKQGAKYRVVGNTTIVAQNEKEVTSDRLLNVLVDDTDYAISAGEKVILQSTAIKSDRVEYAIPANADKLVTVEPNGLGGYTLTAATLAANANMTWVPVAYHVNSKDAAAQKFASNYTATITGSAVTVVYVDYELNVTEYVNGKVTSKYLLEQLNIPYSVVTEAKADKAVLDKFYKQYGSKFNRSELGTAISVAPTLLADEPASLKAANNLIDNAMNGKKLIIAEIFEEYTGTGITSFYKRYDEFAKQVDLLFENLKVLTNSKVLQTELGDYLPMFFELIEALEELQKDVPSMEPSKYIDLKASTLANLNALLTTNDVKKYTSANALTDRATVNGEVAGMVYVNVSTAAKVNGQLTGEVSESLGFAYNHELTSQDITNIKFTLNTLTRDFDTEHYVSSGYTLPKAGDKLVKNIDIADVWVPKTYTVNVVEESATVATHEVTYENATVELPKHPVAGYRYDYYDAENTLLTGETYTVTIDVFDKVFATGSTTITRKTVNVAATQLKETINAFDESLGDMKSGFALLERQNTRSLNSQYAVVFQLDMSELANAKNIIMNWALSLAGAPYAYIGMGDNNHPFWADAKLSVQAVIDSVLESDVSMQALMDVIEDGQLSNAKMNSLLTGYTVVGANHPDVYGGLVIDSYLHFGDDADNALEVPFFITLTDVTGENAGRLDKVDTYLAKALPYANVDTEDDRLNVAADLSVYRLYEAVLAGMLVTGYVDIDDVTDVDVKAVFEYLRTQFHTIVDDETVTFETFENTLTKLGVNKDVSQYEETANKVLNVLRKITNNVSLGEVTEEGNKLVATLTANIKPVLNKLGLSDALLNLIAENQGDKAELTVPMSFTLENFDEGYQAFIFDNSKAGLEKVKFTNALATDLAKAGHNAIVVLLSDYEGNLTVNNGVIVDLNGKTVNGTLTNKADATVKVFNSDFNNDGGITKVVGKYNITGGSYETDVTGMVPAGYVQENGTVQHEMYTLTEDASGNITLTINADKYAVATEADLKYFAVDAAIKLGVNFYTAGALEIDGNGIYAVEVKDVVDVLDGATKASLINEALSSLDCEGITAFANTLLADVTDFGAIATAIENGNELVSYTLTTTPWGVEVAVSEDNYVTVNMTGDENVKVNRTVKVKVSGKEELLVDVFKHLENIVEVNTAKVELKGVSYDAGFAVDANAEFDVTVDFTDDARYTTIMAIILGYTNPEMKDAIHAYIVDYNKAALVEAVDNLTTKDIIAAVKGAHNVSFNTMVKALGLTGKVDDAAELEANYHRYLNVLYAVANRIDVVGNNTKMANWKDGETYTVSRENWDRMNLRLTAKLFAEPTVAEPVVTPKVTLSKESIYGYKYDAENAILYLDTVELGISPEMFSAGSTPVFFGLTDCTYVKHEFTSGLVKVTDGSERIANGAKLVVTVLDNAGKEVNFEFTIMILGDVNANGRIDSNDLRMMLLHDLDKDPIAATDTNALWAADINGNSKVDSNDMLHLKIKTLYQYENSEVLGYPYDSHLLAE